MTGTSCEAVRRVLAGFERAGLTGRDAGRIVIPDRQAIAAEAWGGHGGHPVTAAEGMHAAPISEA